MSYAGNSSLNEETKNRIQTTFGQTLQLASAGRLQEASLGCDFILKMDAQFTPARRLLERLEGAAGPVDTSGLDATSAATEPAPDVGQPAPGGLPPLPGALPAAPGQPAATPPVAPTAGAPAPGPSPATSEGVGASPAAADPSLAGGGELDLLDGPALASPIAPEQNLGGAAVQPPVSPVTVEAPLAEPEPIGAPSLSSGSGPADDGRVQALLQEGQTSFDRGAYQAAIDAWSRIFLIDIDHDEASQKIEAARRLKDESERALEERFFGAVDRIEAGELVEGRALLEEVLQLHPEHVGAQERIRALDAAAAAALTPDTVIEDSSGDPSGPVSTGTFGGLSSESGVVQVGGPSAPAVGAGAAPFSPPPKAAGSPKKRGGLFAERRFLFIGAGALLVFLGVCGFLWTNWDSLFSNQKAAPKEVSFNIPDPMADATRRHVAGDIEGAIAILENVPETSGRYQRAQEQIADWQQDLLEAETTRTAAEAGFRDRLARREALLESARRLYAEGEFFLAAKDFNTAAKIESLDGPTSELFEDAKRQLLPIQQQITLFREGEWERMQAPLWSILEAEPSNRDARGLLVDSYYNLGVQALRNGSPGDAMGLLQEADRLRPADPMVERLVLLASAYSGRESVDALYSIFVEELSYRQ